MYGCLAYIQLPPIGRQKIDPRSRKGIFVGYSTITRGYRIWDPIDKKIKDTKHVSFDEDKMGYEEIYQKNAKKSWHNELWTEYEAETDKNNELKEREIRNEMQCEVESDRNNKQVRETRIEAQRNNTQILKEEKRNEIPLAHESGFANWLQPGKVSQRPRKRSQTMNDDIDINFTQITGCFT